jgi:hypothetical protein
MNLVDQVILDQTANLIAEGRFSNNLGQLTNALYFLAKLKYVRPDGSKLFCERAVSDLIKAPQLGYRVACRNLWNFYALDHHSVAVLDKCAASILEAPPNELNQLDVANALRAFAHFDYVHFECLEKLLKISINRTQEFNLMSLAVVVNSFAQLDIVNPTLLAIVKEVIL